jgi:hypothetical protein
MPHAGISIVTIDPTIVRRLMGGGARPGSSRTTVNAGLLLFEGSSTARDGPPAHHFLVEFGTENTAAAIANWLWSMLRGHVTSLNVGDEPVEIHHGAIKRALIAAAQEPASRRARRG